MFTEIFNELLEDHGLNRKKFAEASGIPYTTVIGWTTLDRLPDYTALIKIADFFDCSIDFLTGRSNIDEKPEYAVSGDREQTARTATEYSSEEAALLRDYRELDTENRKFVSKLVSALRFANKKA